MTDRASFDATAFFAAIDGQRQARGLLWKHVADEAKLSPSTLTRLAQGKRPDVDSLAALLDWAGLSADSFVVRGEVQNEAEPLAMISSYLRADRNLSPAAAEALEKVVKATYEASRRRKAMAFRRGFKAEAERLAVAVRQELGIGVYRCLNPFTLAKHLAIPIASLSQLAERQNHQDLHEAVSVLHGEESSSFSALTVVRGSRRMVIYNDSHDPARVSNSVTHELGHGLMLHEAAPALDHLGCRIWNADHEDEANYLAAALLIPRQLAWSIAKRQVPLDDAADNYGCSTDVVRWRINVTGARRVLAS